MKMFAKKILNIACGVTFLSFFLFPTLSSCSNQNNGKIEILKRSHTTFSHNVYVDFKVPQNSGNIVYAFIKKSSSDLIKLHDSEIRIDNGDIGELYLVIDESVNWNTVFSFDIEFSYLDLSGFYKKETIYDITITYIFEIVDKQDDIFVDSKTIFRTNSHVFDYRFYLNTYPDSNIVQVELLNDKYRKLSLNGKTSLIQTDSSGLIYFDVTVGLDMSIFKNQSFVFDLNFSFINSYHIWQNTTIKNFVVSFIKQRSEEIPMEYFDWAPDMSVIPDGKKVLGIRDDVSPAERGTYSILRLPENTVIVDKLAFGYLADASWWSSIKKIIIPNTVKKIGESAFSGCINVIEIDISDYGKDEDDPDWLPDWLEEPNILFPVSSLPSCGYIWSGALADDDVLNQKMVQSGEKMGIGLPPGWRTFNDNKVTHLEDFTLSEDQTSITGISEVGFKNLPNKKVIKIPDSIIEINANLADTLSRTPYINSENRHETRRLFFGHKLQEISQDCFYKAGISGPLIIYAPDLKTIYDCTFQSITSYEAYYSDLVSEQFQIYFVDCFNLIELNTQCFAFNNITVSQDEFIVPNNVQRIGAYAFLGHQFKKITFGSKLTVLRTRCFSNNYFQPPSPTISVIDMSKVTDSSIFDNASEAFLNACVSKGQLLVNSSVKNSGSNEDWDEKCKNNLGIPSDWTIIECDS